MKKIFFATRVRGFFRHLFSNEKMEYEIINNYKGFYELNSRKRRIITKIAKSSLFDFLGVIQIIKCNNKEGDINGSFNRFLDSDKSYFIYLENPTALYHYKLGRGKSILGKKRISKYLNDKNLKAIVCMSQACYNTFDDVCGNWKKGDEMKKVIYPLVPRNNLVSEQSIDQRVENEEVHLLFIAQGIRFLSKGALEVIEAFKRLRADGRAVNLTMITSIEDVDDNLINSIRKMENIKLLDFTLSYEQMEKIYAESTILLQPTSDESFGLTILEGIKAGLPVLATKLYAIPEMVNDGFNGYLTDPQWWFFDNNNIPNPKVWNHREETIYSGKIDDKIIQFLYEKISHLDDNRDTLKQMSLNSLKVANSDSFNEEKIILEWNNLFNSLCENGN
ncbi:glycosyltransferase family 4 protein [Metabacillus iocasae]|uniref:Glycosyltransferase involved in cell wall biosynthesis n=1 Tax=Priestia iocasae TaxID=2291674 RepID=A0ABS2QS84_9BACI|nr:glycosyltransferase [Metabacillus iocasae]MBM7702306.1 glycosyltransferase involved in cell wall biosynthesis [Metabacillus iocasae]